MRREGLRKDVLNRRNRLFSPDFPRSKPTQYNARRGTLCIAFQIYDLFCCHRKGVETKVTKRA